LEIVDKHSTAAGLECRLPYFDYDLVEFANTLPLRFKFNNRQGVEKYIFKRFVLENYGMDLFDIVVRRKLGFPMASGVYSRWLNKFCQDTVSHEYKERLPLGQCFVDRFGLLLFDMFCEIFLKYRGFPPAEFDALEFIKSAR